MFLYFFLTFYNVFMFFKCHVVVVVKTKTYNITNRPMMHFSWAKTPFPGQSKCFVAVGLLLTLFESY